MSGTVQTATTLSDPQTLAPSPDALGINLATAIRAPQPRQSAPPPPAVAAAQPTPGVGTMTIDLVDNPNSAPISAKAQTALAYAAHYLGSLIHDQATVTIGVDFTNAGRSGYSALGSPDLYWLPLAQAEHYIGLNAPGLANAMPSVLPPGAYGAGQPNGNIEVSAAEERAWGISLPAGGTTQGNITVNTYYLNNPHFDATYYGTIAANTGSFQNDFTGVILHELAHALGRTSMTNATMSNGGHVFTPLDLFRFSSPGSLDVTGTTTPAPYFSTDNGTTTLGVFSAGDPADWLPGSTLTPNDAFALSGSGPATISATDLTVMNALGFATGSLGEVALPITLATGTDSAFGSADDYIVADGNNVVTTGAGADTVKAHTGAVTIDAASGTGSIRAGIPTGYAGSIDFVGGSGQAVILGNAGRLDAKTGAGAVSLFGGTGGNNSIIGGSGALFATGGGDNSTIVANSAQTNYLFAGTGAQTLIAGAGTTTNLFRVNSASGGDVMISHGAGTQNFFLAAGTSTLTGSTVAGATNVFFAGNHAGGACVITNFADIAGQITSFNGVAVQTVTAATYAGTKSSAVTLTDGTRITLLNTPLASLTWQAGGTSVT